MTPQLLTLKVLAALLHYPDEELQAHGNELIAVLADDELLKAEERGAVVDFIDRLCDNDLLEAQSEYVDTFDRGRSRSLYLFEHVHGESRDRGEAMVELLHVYREAGFDISVPELPDYVPLFLEFISTLPAEQALAWLEETGHLLQMLHARLAGRGNPYAVLLEPLVRLAGLDPHDAEFSEEIAAEKPDDTRQALDSVWMEEPVTFGPEGGTCGSDAARQSAAQPLRRYDALPH